MVNILNLQKKHQIQDRLILGNGLRFVKFRGMIGVAGLMSFWCDTKAVLLVDSCDTALQVKLSGENRKR